MGVWVPVAVAMRPADTPERLVVEFAAAIPQDAEEVRQDSHDARLADLQDARVPASGWAWTNATDRLTTATWVSS
ncbi:hypothetical protein AB0M45_01415 [Nocardia sp. NPDC051787]|uniref:hypothetical protein n=1 Tax=Nocardia sp. NPDC051787 TaxID=3155415 RepID=UPI003434CE66